MVSVIQGHKNPFRDEVQALNEAQMDFILEMESIDNPDRLTFKRNNRAEVVDVRVAWANVLRGKAKQEYLGESLLAAVRRRLSKAANQPRIGFVRGKKPE